MAGQCPGDDDAAVAGRAGHAGHLTGGPASTLGAQPGILAALHTWSQTLVLHPHVHCLVTGGGLTPGGAVEGRPPGVSAPCTGGHGGVSGEDAGGDPPGVWRGGVGVAGGDAAAAGLNLLNRLGHPRRRSGMCASWSATAHGAGVVTSLARYLRGGPIKNAPSGGLRRRARDASPIVRARRRRTAGALRPSG